MVKIKKSLKLLQKYFISKQNFVLHNSQNLSKLIVLKNLVFHFNKPEFKLKIQKKLSKDDYSIKINHNSQNKNVLVLVRNVVLKFVSDIHICSLNVMLMLTTKKCLFNELYNK